VLLERNRWWEVKREYERHGDLKSRALPGFFMAANRAQGAVGPVLLPALHRVLLQAPRPE
jgi:hypothetical protein